MSAMEALRGSKEPRAGCSRMPEGPEGAQGRLLAHARKEPREGCLRMPSACFFLHFRKTQSFYVFRLSQ